MLRSFLISLSKAAWAQRLVTGWKFAWRAASRFVAGSTIQEAIIVVRESECKGINVSLDHLGESTTTREEAIRATNDILELLDQIDRAGVRANVSVKLTQVGLALDEELCSQNLERILIVPGNMGILCALTWKIRLILNRQSSNTGRCAPKDTNRRVW